MLTRAQIETALSVAIEQANERYRRASDHLADVTADLPSGVPLPDGTLRIKNAGEEHRAALAEVRRALMRWDAFVVHGTVPDDLPKE